MKRIMLPANDRYIKTLLHDYAESPANRLFISSDDTDIGIGTIVKIGFWELLEIRGNEEDGYEVIWVGDGIPGATSVFDMEFVGSLRQWCRTNKIDLLWSDTHKNRISEPELDELQAEYQEYLKAGK